MSRCYIWVISSVTDASWEEATFHASGTVNQHKCRIWSYENPHITGELERDSAKVNVWVSLMHDMLIGPFFVSEETVTKILYLDMLELFMLPQLPPQTVFQHDRALPHFIPIIKHHLDCEMPVSWIVRGGQINLYPQFPDLAPLDLCLRSYVKNITYQNKFTNLQHLKAQIMEAVASVNQTCFVQHWMRSIIIWAFVGPP